MTCEHINNYVLRGRTLVDECTKDFYVQALTIACLDCDETFEQVVEYPNHDEPSKDNSHQLVLSL